MTELAAKASDQTKNRVSFSYEQDFLRLQHETDGSSTGYGHRSISSAGWWLAGALDIDLLRQALNDVVARNEALRASISSDDDGWYQNIKDPAQARLVVHHGDSDEPRERQAEEFLNEIEGRTVRDDDHPKLWAFLRRFDEQSAVLVLVSYLPVVDLWSINLVMHDLATCYTARCRGEVPKHENANQYREYVRWQRENQRSTAAISHFDYWRDKLSGAHPVVVTADRPSSADVAGVTSVHRFSLGAELGSATLKLARDTRTTPFIVLFAVYVLHLWRQTGTFGGVVWTLTPGPGRRHEWAAETVGYFVNMVPLHTELTGCVDFRQVLGQVRETCMGAYSKEVPFVQLAAEVAEAVGSLEQPGMVVPGFVVYQDPGGSAEHSFGEGWFSPILRRQSQDAGPNIPQDAILWAVDIGHSGELVCSVNASADRFDRSTIVAMSEDFQEILRKVVAAPNTPLDELWSCSVPGPNGV